MYLSVTSMPSPKAWGMVLDVVDVNDFLGSAQGPMINR
jgi:hypothetical protein